MTDGRILLRATNRIVAVEDGCIVAPQGPFAAVLEFPECELRPGLINAHDHLHRNHYGRLGNPPYHNTREWASDVERTCRRELAAGQSLPRREALLFGAWKNLFAGVTTVVHHDRWEPDFERDFPLRVVTMPVADAGKDFAQMRDDRPWTVHLAEGVDDVSAREVRVLHRNNVLDENLVAVHCVGPDAVGIELLRKSGAAIVWCPSSNLFLFGRTAPAELLADGIDVLLGSDSLLSGAGNLLDEITVARRIGPLNDDRIEAAVGLTAARRLGLPAPALELGDAADLVVMARPLIDASSKDVELVMVGGVPRVASSRHGAIFHQLGRTGRSLTVAGAERWICEDAMFAKPLMRVAAD